MTKAQLEARIAELEKEVEALKAGANCEVHYHYVYPQTVQPAQQPNWYPYWSVIPNANMTCGSDTGTTWNTTGGNYS